MKFVSNLLNKLAGLEGISILNWGEKVAYEPVKLKEPREYETQGRLYWQSIEYFKRVNAQDRYIQVLQNIITGSESKLEEIDKLIKEKEVDFNNKREELQKEINELKESLKISRRETKNENLKVVELQAKHAKMNSNNQRLSTELMTYRKRKVFNE